MRSRSKNAAPREPWASRWCASALAETGCSPEASVPRLRWALPPGSWAPDLLSRDPAACLRRGRAHAAGAQTRTITASPCPPPEQIAAQPRPPPRRRSSSTSEPRMRAPEAPIGWPSATAPPLTLTRSSSMPSSADRVERDRGERLVDLPHVDVCRAQTGLLQRLRGGRGGRAREVGEVVAALRVGDDLAEHLPAVGGGPLLGGDHQRAGGVVDAGGVARGVRALLADQAGQRGELLQRCVAARPLVDLDDGVALLALHGDGHDLLGAGAPRRSRPARARGSAAPSGRGRRASAPARRRPPWPRRTSACRRRGW